MAVQPQILVFIVTANLGEVQLHSALTTFPDSVCTCVYFNLSVSATCACSVTNKTVHQQTLIYVQAALFTGHSYWTIERIIRQYTCGMSNTGQGVARSFSSGPQVSKQSPFPFSSLSPELLFLSPPPFPFSSRIPFPGGQSLNPVSGLNKRCKIYCRNSSQNFTLVDRPNSSREKTGQYCNNRVYERGASQSDLIQLIMQNGMDSV